MHEHRAERWTEATRRHLHAIQILQGYVRYACNCMVLAPYSCATLLNLVNKKKSTSLLDRTPPMVCVAPWYGAWLQVKPKLLPVRCSGIHQNDRSAPSTQRRIIECMPPHRSFGRSGPCKPNDSNVGRPNTWLCLCMTLVDTYTTLTAHTRRNGECSTSPRCGGGFCHGAEVSVKMKWPLVALKAHVALTRAQDSLFRRNSPPLAQNAH